VVCRAGRGRRRNASAAPGQRGGTWIRTTFLSRSWRRIPCHLFAPERLGVPARSIQRYRWRTESGFGGGRICGSALPAAYSYRPSDPIGAFRHRRGLPCSRCEWMRGSRSRPPRLVRRPDVRPGRRRRGRANRAGRRSRFHASEAGIARSGTPNRSMDEGPSRPRDRTGADFSLDPTRSRGAAGTAPGVLEHGSITVQSRMGPGDGGCLSRPRPRGGEW